MKAILIGFGDIAPKHLEVLKNKDCEVVGLITKNKEKCLQKALTNKIPQTFSSIEEINQKDVDFFVVMVDPNSTSEILEKLIPFKKPILVEKPVSLGSKKLERIINLKNKHDCPIMVAMNRRFYSIFHKGLEFLKEKNKKLDAIAIEAPERFSDIMKSKFSDIAKENWKYCNPIHCIDLIRFFGGDVIKFQSNSDPDRFLFNAIGTLSKNVKFNYLSNWRSPGSWGVTLYAENLRITFNPLEKGIINENGTITEIIPNEEDILFKPGFLQQIDFFINYLVKQNKFVFPMCDLEDHKKTLELIEKIHLN